MAILSIRYCGRSLGATAEAPTTTPLPLSSTTCLLWGLAHIPDAHLNHIVSSYFLVLFQMIATRQVVPARSQECHDDRCWDYPIRSVSDSSSTIHTCLDGVIKIPRLVHLAEDQHQSLTLRPDRHSHEAPQIAIQVRVPCTFHIAATTRTHGYQSNVRPHGNAASLCAAHAHVG